MNNDSLSTISVSGDQLFWLVFANLSAVFFLKLSLIVIGFLVIRMGCRLLRDGVKGEFKFKSDLHGFKADLASASPGTLFLVLGVAVLVYAVTATHDIPFRQSLAVSENPGLETDGIPEKNPFE